MALNILGFPEITYAKIGTVEIDVSLSEDHRFRADITDNPVENGTVFSDNVVLQPIVIDMEGRISDATQSILNIRGPGTSIDGFKALLELQRKRETFEVKTGIAIYKNMMFEELSIPRIAGDGRSLRFTATLREILVVGEDAETNRDRIADGVKHSALPTNSKGMVTKVAA